MVRVDGTEKSTGPGVFSISGKVERPGNYEAPMGATARELIAMAGGIKDGKQLKAFTPGGSSTPFLTADHLDTAMDFDAVAAAGSLLGTKAMIVLDDRDCVVDTVLRFTRFYAHESCGKCTPCRVGGDWAVRTYERILSGEGDPHDLEILDRVQAGLQQGRCLCGLGDSAGWVIESTMKHFRDEYEEHCLRNECSAAKLKAASA